MVSLGFLFMDWDLLRSLSVAFSIIAGLSLPSVVIERRGRPLAALGWILVLVAVPPIGVIAWWAIGHDYLERKKLGRRLSSNRASDSMAELEVTQRTQPLPSAAILPIKQVPSEEAFGFFPPSSGNTVSLLVDGPACFPAMESLIRSARHHVHALFYIWRADSTGQRLRDLLIAKAKEGVEVRVLCDGVGSPKIRGRFMKELREAGGKAHAFLPPQVSLSNLTLNFRNHRKLLIVDGEAAITGSFNIGHEYETEWHDIGVKVSGPIVDQIQEVFADDWYFATGENLFTETYFVRWTKVPAIEVAGLWRDVSCGVIASGPDSRGNPTHDAFFIALTSAQKRIWITTPYFVPNSAILTALRTAVFKGVDVRVLVPADSDIPLVRLAARSFYDELLSSGVRIFEYPRQMIHAKAIVIDDELAILGSANIDSRSFRLNFELNTYLGSRGINKELADLFASKATASHEVTLEQVRSQPYLKRFAESVAHLMSPLL